MSPQPHTRTRHACARLAIAAIAVAASVSLLAASPAAAATFDRENVISDDNFRASLSMSRGEIQAFLDAMPGVLKTYQAKDHNGIVRPASKIIYDAAIAWNISPKVILCMLQKEQSLLTITPSMTTSADMAERLREAMGCGIFKGSTNTYPGFGNQVWNGTRKLSTYWDTFDWYPGKRIKVYGDYYITPANVSTWSLYIYNPSTHGNEVFWTCYWRYFGDPHRPARMQPVYRLLNTTTRTYRYTSSDAERVLLTTRYRHTYRYEKIGFSVDTSAPANATPIYRLVNSRSGATILTHSKAQADRLSHKSGSGWRYRGICFRASRVASEGAPVYALFNPRTLAHIYTRSYREREMFIHDSRFRFRDDGIAFWLASYVAPPPPPPSEEPTGSIGETGSIGPTGSVEPTGSIGETGPVGP